jgi:hypothetical protein
MEPTQLLHEETIDGGIATTIGAVLKRGQIRWSVTAEGDKIKAWDSGDFPIDTRTIEGLLAKIPRAPEEAPREVVDGIADALIRMRDAAHQAITEPLARCVARVKSAG